MLIKEHVQRQFARSANRYDEFAGMQRDIVDELLGVLDIGIDSAVDLGCGTGYGLRRLAALSEATLTGLDLAPDMLSVASDEIVPDNVVGDCQPVSFVLGDIESLPFKDRCFDLVLSSSALQWCELSRALMEIRRITRPGGQIRLSSFLNGTLRDWRRLWSIDEHNRFLSYAEFTQCIEAVGFKNPRIWRRQIRQTFYTFESAVASVRDLGAGNAGRERPKGLMGKQRFRQIRQNIEAQIEREGSIALPYEVVFVSAVKG